MVDIAKKRLPAPVILILVYLSYSAMSWYMMRGGFAYYAERYGLGAWFANDIVVILFGGLVPFAIYVLFSFFTFKRMKLQLGMYGDVSAVQYGLHYAVIAANLVLFGLKFMFFAIPMYAPMINIIIDPVITLGFVALYLLYAFKREYLDKCVFRSVIMRVLGTFLLVYGLLAVINLITAVAAL